MAGEGATKSKRRTSENGKTLERRCCGTRVDLGVLLPRRRRLPALVDDDVDLARLVGLVRLFVRGRVVRADVGAVRRLEVLHDVPKHLLRERVADLGRGVDAGRAQG